MLFSNIYAIKQFFKKRYENAINVTNVIIFKISQFPLISKNPYENTSV